MTFGTPFSVKPKMKPLSDKPSKILQQALDDLIALMDRPDVKFNMSSTWFAGKGVNYRNACSVCHAGAVMMNRYNVEDQDAGSISPDLFNKVDEAKFNFINDIRTGMLFDALQELAVVGVIPHIPDFVVSEASAYAGVKVDRDTFMVPTPVSDFKPHRRKDYIHYIQGMIGILQAEGM